MSHPSTGKRAGRVWLIGAGPGDPELLTLKAARALREADVVLVDDLVDRRVLAHARPGARVVEVGKRGGCRSTPQAFIERLMTRLARRGAAVARLKGGDPFVFGRGGEETAALQSAGIAVEVVPGVTAALGAAAALGIPATHREVARSITLVTGHARDGSQPNWRALRAAGGTLAIYMGIARLEEILGCMLAAGFPPEMPACAIQNATLPGQRTAFAPLADLPRAVKTAGLTSPAIVMVGEVVRRAASHAASTVDAEARVA
jgi:uroporphyrin-III C-methyltransferase